MNESQTERTILPAAGAQTMQYPLGPLEETFWSVGNRFHGDGTGTISARLGGIVRPETLSGALAILQKRHPRLRARIVTSKSGRACYEVSPSMSPIPVFVKRFPAQELPWASEAQRSLEIDFNPQGPLVHVTVLQSDVCPVSELMLTIHHSLTDGTAGLMLLHQLLANYEELWSGKSLESVLDATESLPFVAADIPPITAPWRDRWQMFVRHVREYMRKRRSGWTVLPSDSPEYSPRWFRQQLSSDDTLALERLFRKRRISVYGALFALAVTSLAESMPSEPVQFACRCPINMRDLPYCERQISYEHLGCFVAGLDRVYTLSKPYDFWGLARAACDDVREFTVKQGPAMALTLVPWAGRLAGVFRISPKRPPMRDTISVNYIPCPTTLKQQYGDLTLESITGLNRCRYMGVSLTVAGTLMHGRINLVLGAVNVSERLREAFHATLIANIGRLIRGEI